MLIVEDMIRSLQWEMFWQHKDKTDFPVLTQVMTLQTTLTARQRCPELFDTLTGQVNMLQHEFLEFEQECEAKSELCRFFGLWLQMAAIVKNAVVADREGNWNLHVATTEDSMKIFAEFDCMNYLRWYLEQIKVLEFTHPDLYRRFAMGQWVVRDRPGWFCAVGGDMKVEQTIQHALSTTRRLTFNHNVAKLLDFVLERQNPYSLLCSVPVPLHNLLTKLAVDREVAARLLKCLEYGEIVYRSYRRERLVEKMKKISSTIPKCKLPKFIDQPHTTPSTVQKDKMDISPKDVAEAQRNIDMAKERGMEVRQILAHDVLSDSTLFDGDLPAHANKAKLVAEIEPLLDPSEWNQTSTLATHVVVDFMSKMRQMPLAQFRTFGDVINAIIVSATHICRESEFVHLVLDSYIEMSVKEGERLRRTDFAGINIVGMNEDTPIPRQLDKLWASEENKRNLQLLVRDIVCGLGNCSATAIVSSVVSDGEVLPAKTADGEEIPDLLNWIEEADARLVEHVDWTVRVKQCKRIVIVSNDTDTFALLLHYTPHFQAMGLKEIWQQFGTGEKRRMLALHQAVAKLGAPLAKTMIKAHILSGYDCMSKVGTKHAAMASDPVQYLTNFGEALPMSEQDAALSEKYLVRVWAGVRSTVTADTFDQLRVEHYTSASAGIDALPPTSSVERTLWYIATI